MSTGESMPCAGSRRTPRETTDVNGSTWGRCRSCRQWRPLRMDGAVKIHSVVAGISTQPESQATS